MKYNPQCLFIAFVLSICLTQSARSAVGFTIMPAAVSNTYNGTITLQVTGLAASGDSVVVQKYLDANTNGVIDAGDILWQQFNLTDGNAGMVIGGVTNINVPGDTDSTTKQITAKLNFQGDFSQGIAGKYLYKLSGNFTPITNLFTVTNFPYAQKFTGTVVSNGVAVPNAVIILFPANGNGNPVGGAVANNSGVYNLPAPAGTYSLIPFKTNFIANFATAPLLVLSNNSTLNTNLSLIPATQTISGKIVDANNLSLGLPGLLVPVQTQDRGLLGICFTDTNGNFSVRVTANQWQIADDSAGPTFHGYLVLQNKTTADTTSGNVSGVTIGFPKAAALFYGTVKDNLGNPLPMSVAIEAQDNNNGLYDADGYTDANGNYVTAALGNLGSSDPWVVQIDNSSSFPNYIFSQSPLSQNGGTNMTAGKVVLQNFTAILATNHITGHVQFTNAPVAGVQVNAEATINGVDYNSQMDTDGNGNYSLNVANGDWTVSVFDCCDDDSLNNLLGGGNYVTPDNQDVNINNNNGSADFTVIPIGGPMGADKTPLPSGAVGVFYEAQIQVWGGVPISQDFPYVGGLISGSLPPGLDFSDGEYTSYSGFFVLSGTPTQSGTFSFVAVAYDADNNQVTNVYSVTISPLLLSAPAVISGGDFKFMLTGVSNQNYTVQMSTNLSSPNWIPLFVTNNPAANSFVITDPYATNQQRFYRILIGP